VGQRNQDSHVGDGPEAFESTLWSVVLRAKDPAAAALGISVGHVRNWIRAARTRYRDAILNVIRSCTDIPEEAQEELQDLFSAFS